MHFNLFEPKILPLEQVVEERKYEFPTFQRDFVWTPKKMKTLMESIYHGIPINAIYLWNRVGVVMKDGTKSDRETKLVIDGQQRLTSMKAILLGEEYLTKSNRLRKIRFAFNPVAGTFHQVDSKFTPGKKHVANLAQFYAAPEAETVAFLHRNRANLTETQREDAVANLKRLGGIKQYPIVIYDISNEADIDRAYQCFQLTNAAGTKVSKGDLCMAWLETYQPLLAEGITLFAQGIQFGKRIQNPRKESREFKRSKFSKSLEWLKRENARVVHYQPKIEHVAELLFHLIQGGKKFQLGTIAQQLLAKETEYVGNENVDNENVDNEKISKVEKAFLSLVSQNNYNRFNQIIGQFPGINETNKNYAYWLFLQCVNERKRKDEIAHLLQRWYLLQLMSNGRVSGAVAFSRYMDGFLQGGGLVGYLESLETELQLELWDRTLPDKLVGNLAPKARKPIIKAWEMTQILSRQTALFDNSSLIETLHMNKLRSEHHIYPQNELKDMVPQSKIDAVANIALTTTEINSAIRDKNLHVFILAEQAEGRLLDADEHLANHCIPKETGQLDYPDFLEKRAELMAKRFKKVYLSLKS